MRCDDLSADRQAESDASRRHGAAGLGLIESSEDFLLVSVGNSRPGIGDAQQNSIATKPAPLQRSPTLSGHSFTARWQIDNAHSNFRPRRRKFYGILEEVVEHLHETGSVAAHEQPPNRL